MPLTLDQKLALVEKLEGLGKKAIEQIEWVLDNEDDSAALLKAATEVLDRIGFAKSVKQEIQGQVDLSITINHRFPQAAIVGEAIPVQITHRDGN